MAKSFSICSRLRSLDTVSRFYSVCTRENRQLYMKRGSLVFLAAHSDLSSVIAHNRLHNRQPQSSAMLLGGVIGSEKALALFRSKPCTSIGKFKHGKPVCRGSKKRQ